MNSPSLYVRMKVFYLFNVPWGASERCPLRVTMLHLPMWAFVFNMPMWASCMSCMRCIDMAIRALRSLTSFLPCLFCEVFGWVVPDGLLTKHAKWNVWREEIGLSKDRATKKASWVRGSPNRSGLHLVYVTHSIAVVEGSQSTRGGFLCLWTSLGQGTQSNFKLGTINEVNGNASGSKVRLDSSPTDLHMLRVEVGTDVETVLGPPTWGTWDLVVASCLSCQESTDQQSMNYGKGFRQSMNFTFSVIHLVVFEQEAFSSSWLCWVTGILVFMFELREISCGNEEVPIPNTSST